MHDIVGPSVPSTLSKANPQPKFGAILAGDIGGRGGSRFKIFHEQPAFTPLDTGAASDMISIDVGKKTVGDITMDELLSHWTQGIAEEVKKNRQHFRQDPIRAVGIAIPGSVRHNIIQLANNLSANTSVDWRNVDLASLLKPKLLETFEAEGLGDCIKKDVTIRLANDLLTGILGERRYGAGQDMQEGILHLIQLGTGYGGSTMILNPECETVVPGEPGHLKLAAPTLDADTQTEPIEVESVVGHHGIMSQADKTGLGTDLAPHLAPNEVIHEAFHSQDPNRQRKAMAIVTRVIDTLAVSLASMTQWFNVQNQRFILGGGNILDIEREGGPGTVTTMLKASLAKYCRKEEWEHTQLSLAAFGNNLVGAAVLATLNHSKPDNPATEATAAPRTNILS